MSSYELTATPSRYKDDIDKWDIDQVLNVLDDRGKRCRVGVGYVGPDGTCRRVYQGPVGPGPYLYTFPLAIVIDNHGGSGAESQSLRERGLEFDLDDGDQVSVNGVTFTFKDGRGRFTGAHYGEFTPVGE